MPAHKPFQSNNSINFLIGAAVGAAILAGLWLTVQSRREARRPERVLTPSLSSQEKWAKTLSDYSNSSEEGFSQQGRLAVDYTVDESMIADLSELQGIETLILDQGVVGDESMDVIADLPKLTHLRLRFSAISDIGLEKLSRCDSLQILNLPQSICTASGIDHLSQLSRLRQLRLGSDQLTNKASESIAKLKTLESLHLIGVKITDEGLRKIASLPELQSLYLDDSAVTDEGWDWLIENHSDLHIHVNQNHLDRDPKKHQH